MLIDDIDFVQLYRNHVALTSRKSKPAKHWDARAEKASRTCGDTSDPYIADFINYVDVSGAKTLLDIGCGPGTICLPLAHQFEKVYALDYSAGMLDVVQARAQAQQINNVQCLLHSWDERNKEDGQAWQDVPECDVVVCSRASMVNDIEDALQKINSKARLRAYMTLTVEPYKLESGILGCFERDVVGFPNFMYAVNVLYQMGYMPKVNYIDAQDCKARCVEDGLDAFLKDVRWSIGELSAAEVKALEIYYEQEHAGLQKQLKPQRRVWAMVYWDTFTKRKVW